MRIVCGNSPSPLFLLYGGGYHMTSDMPVGEVRRGSKPYAYRYARGGKFALGVRSHPKLLIFLVLPIAGHSGLSTLVAFSTWPIVPTPLMSV